MKRIAVLGSGDWSKKITKSLKNDFLVSEFSARALHRESVSIDNSYDLVWITSRNSDQLKLSELLLKSDFKGKLILEKPYFTNIDEKDILIGLIGAYPKQVYFSQVWAHSRLWKEYLKTFLHQASNFRISALRVGVKRRLDFPPVLDWLPHDIYLALDLSTNLKEEISILTSNWESDNETCLVTIAIGGKHEMIVVAGYSAERKNTWRTFFTNGDCIELDFVKLTIKYNETIIYQESVQEKYDVPVLNFANWVLDQEIDSSLQDLIKLNSCCLPENRMK